MINWPAAQRRLGVTADGKPGPVTYGALISMVANAVVPNVIDIASALAAHVPSYSVDVDPDRLAGFIGQCCHESGGFRDLQERGGYAYFTRLYENRADLGNTQPGDGARFHGRGLIQLTGRANYRRYGADLGFNLVGNPDLVASPSLAVLTALQFWMRNGLNEFADKQDWTGMTRVINGGTRGIRERIVLIQAAKGLLA